MHLVYGALVVLVVTTIITESYLFRPVRSLASRISPHVGVLFSCFLCMGTWVGIGAGFLIQGPLYPVLDGLAFQGLAYLLHVCAELVSDVRVRLQR